MFIVGARAIPSCIETARYYDSIATCVNERIFADPQFVFILTSQKICPGGLIDDASKLEALRRCEIIASSLTIAVADVDADYTALFMIGEIRGECCGL